MLKFWVTEDSAEVREVVEDALGEMEALTTPEDLTLSTEIVVGPRGVDWGTWAGRMIYRVKEEEE